ncbi:MAG: MoaD/ThiS family protein [Actinomadura sp.]
MKIKLHNPKRETEITGRLRADELCRRLGLNRESVLIIRGDELVTGDVVLDEGDTVEIRPVMSGG